MLKCFHDYTHNLNRFQSNRQTTFPGVRFNPVKNLFVPEPNVYPIRSNLFAVRRRTRSGLVRRRRLIRFGQSTNPIDLTEIRTAGQAEIQAAVQPTRRGCPPIAKRHGVPRRSEVESRRHADPHLQKIFPCHGTPRIPIAEASPSSFSYVAIFTGVPSRPIPLVKRCFVPLYDVDRLNG